MKKFVFIALCFFSVGISQTHYVPLKHPVYRVIRIIETTNPHIIQHFQKPYTREEIKAFLNTVISQKTIILNTEMLKRYLNEFENKDHHLVTYKRNDAEFLGDIYFGGQTQTSKGSLPYNRINIGGNIRGHLGSSLSYQTDIITSLFLGNLDFKNGYSIFEPLAPLKNHSFQSSASGDFSESQVMLSTGWGHVSFGSDLVSWGPGSSGHLLMDIQMFSISDVHATATFGPFHYIKFFGTLDKLYPISNGEGKEYLANNRTLVAHRLDIRLSDRIHFGVSESIVYNRNFELSYLNPLIPFTISEVQTGDTDNNLAAIDFSVNIFHNSKSYIEFMVDDMDFRQNWFKDYVNKWAILLGHQWANPLGLKNSLLTLETIRVEPYVYTHRDTANHYELYGQSIGYDLEPNSLRYFASLDWFQQANQWHRLSIIHTLHGDGDRVFGNPANKSDDKEFLKGVFESRTKFIYTFEYEFFENMWLSLGINYESIKDEKIDNTFSEYGSDRNFSGLSLGLSLNY